MSWPCVGTQVKDGSHVVTLTACKQRTISIKLVVDFGPIHGNAYTLAAALAALVYGPITNLGRLLIFLSIGPAVGVGPQCVFSIYSLMNRYTDALMNRCTNEQIE